MSTTIRRPLLVCACALSVVAARAAAQEVIYATSFPINANLLTVDPANGNILTSVAVVNEESLFGGLTRDGNDMYSIDGYNDANSDRTFRIDSSTGVGAIVGNTNFNWNFRCVEIHPQTGVLYASRDNELYTLNKTTGAATSVAVITGANLDQFTCFAIDSNGQAYGVDIGGNGLYQLNLTSGAATFLGDLNVVSFFQDLAFDHTNQLWAVAQGGGVYTIDIASVGATFRFSSGSWGGLTFGGCPDPTAYCTSGATAAGCTVSIGFTGAPSVTASSGFTLTCGNVDALRTGLFFYAVSDPAFVPVPWGSTATSFLCVKAPTQRMNSSNSGGSTGCTGSFAQDWNAFMAANLGALGNPRTVGESFDAQLWMRDPPSPKTTVLSNALRFVLCP